MPELPRRNIFGNCGAGVSHAGPETAGQTPAPQGRNYETYFRAGLKPRLSVLTVAKNEAQNLADCLATVRWADERIVVVDPSSRDETLKVAKREADVVTVRTFDDFASQRNAALALASSDWVLSIDADERVTPNLAAEIRRIISDPGNPYSGFRAPIKSVILGRAFSFSGTQDDLPLRLFRRDAGFWVGPVHETVELRGQVGTLKGFLRHHTLSDLQVFLSKINDYTTLEARGLADAARRYRASDLLLRPLWTFLKLYLYKQGFRDGAEGLLFCSLSGVSVAVRAWKLRELTRRRAVINVPSQCGTDRPSVHRHKDGLAIRPTGSGALTYAQLPNGGRAS
jgi:glycosyltransferase involved in cell wall biosynthesis